jgi:HEAT repeat protein
MKTFSQASHRAFITKADLFLIFAIFISAGTLNAAEPKKSAAKDSGRPVQAVESAPASSVDVTKSTAPVEADLRTNLEKLSDVDPFVRRNAVIYLGSEKNKKYTAELIPMLNDPNREVRRAAVNALSNINDKSAVQPLMDRFKIENDLNVKMQIVVALGELRSALSLNLLKTLLKDPYPAFRNEAVRAMGKLNDKSTYSDLVLMLKDEAESVKVIASNFVRDLKIKSAQSYRIENLQSPSSVVRMAAAQALGEVGDEASIVSLNKLLQDQDGTVVVAVQEAVEKINKKAAAAAAVAPAVKKK